MMESVDQTIYIKKGFASRADYLEVLANEHGDRVYMLADLLGPSEDFDGLISSLEDYSEN